MPALLLGDGLPLNVVTDVGPLNLVGAGVGVGGKALHEHMHGPLSERNLSVQDHPADGPDDEIACTWQGFETCVEQIEDG